MVLEEVYMISQVVAAFAVVASLVFVGLQMRQSDATQQALMHQARTDRHVHMGMVLMEPSHMSLLKKVSEGDGRNLTEDDIEYLSRITRVGMLNSEDILWQCRNGYLDESVLEDQKRVVEHVLSKPAQRAVWQMTKQSFSSDLIAFVDKIERDTPLIDKPEDRKQLYLQILDQMKNKVSENSKA